MFFATGSRRLARRAKSALLRLERLEDRLLPSTVTVQAGMPVRPVNAHMLGANLTFYDANIDTPQTARLVQASGLDFFRISNGSGTEGALHFDQPANERPSFGPMTTAQLLQAVQNFQGTGLVTINYGSGSPQEGLAYLAYLNGQVGDLTPIGPGPQPGDPLFTTAYTAKDWQTVDYWARLRSAAPLNDGSREDALRINHPQPFHFKYWEIGNEQYFGPEFGPDGMAEDHHAYPGGATPANRAALYVTFAKLFSDRAHAIDPSISVGVDVGNPEINDQANPIAQWTNNLLEQCVMQGFTPGFLSDHIYVFGDQPVSDATLLHSVNAPHPELKLDKGPVDWSTRASVYRADLGLLGPAGQGVQLLATETNSYEQSVSKQMTNLVNGLWFADSIGSVLQTEYQGVLFWDLRNAFIPLPPNPNLYGWREGADEGMLGAPDEGPTTAITPALAGGPSPLDGPNVRYPTYFAAQLASHFVHAGDTIEPAVAGADDPNLTAYASREVNGHLALLLIDKDPPLGPNQPAQTKNVTIQIAGFVPAGTAQSWQYGKAEDDQQKATGTSELTANANVPLTVNVAPGMASFSVNLPAYSMTVLDLAPNSTTTLVANPNPSVAGQPVTFTATVTPGSASQSTPPTGTVTFADGGNPLATVPLGSVTTVSAAGTATAASLVDWWKGEGNPLDSAGNQNGTLQGGVFFAPGRVGQAFSFDGAQSSYAQFGPQAFGTADFAVAFWLQTAAAGPQAVLGDRADAGGGNFYSLRMDAAGHLVAELDQDAAGTNDVSLTSNGVVNNGAFHHVALVRSGTTLSLYIDGALDSSAAAAGVTDLLSISPLVAGAEPAVGLVPGFTGLLDEVQVYRRALTGQEVQAIFTAGSAGLTSNNAVLIISTVPAGMHRITATYNGDNIFAPSTSGPPAIWPVMHAATTTALAASVNATLFGQPVTFTATVSVVSPGTTAVAPPGGTVTFADGSTILGTSTLSTSNGVTTATFSTPSLAVGAHSITATYGGDANFLASSAVHVLRQTITYSTASERLVARLYFDLLGRTAEDAGLQFWSALLNRGVSTVAVVTGIQGSLEYRTHVVNDLYRQFLRRDADALGLDAATAFLGAGGTAAHLEAILVGSPEYYQREGGASADGFLTAMYHDVLGRAVDSPSRVYLDQVLTAGARRGDITAAVFASTEFDALWVESLYQRYLGRPFDSLGLATFVNELHGGFSQEQVLAAILSSPEYAGRR